MRAGLSLAAFSMAAAASTGAFAWSWPGHEVVGALASQMLSPKAMASLNGDGTAQNPGLLRGHTLALAATWADCARSVVKNEDSYTYQHSRFTPAACKDFETPSEEALLEDFAKRNWTTCAYLPGKPCHEAWHFTDIAEQRSKYDPSFVGANNFDVVHAINACVTVLQGGQAPAPFNIKDRSEALYLLAHFVGDLHQPLHVGSVYLSPTGSVVDPDAAKPFDPNTNTAGGNAIADGATNLHSDWDGIPKSISIEGSADMLAAARMVPATPGPVSGWAAAWASDTVVQAHTAFANLTFAGGPGGKGWTVDTSADPDYAAHRLALQTTELERAGKRLADLLNNVLS